MQFVVSIAHVDSRCCRLPFLATGISPLVEALGTTTDMLTETVTFEQC